jgi:LPXTG-motif cell wall-anchored protein
MVRLALLLLVLMATPVIADAGGVPHPGSNGVGRSAKGVPGPIAGAGLPVILGLAGWAFWRRRQAGEYAAWKASFDKAE